MTDKQINHEQSSVIIDGVDVSECSLYEDNPKYRMWGTCDCMRSMVDQSGYDELAGAECKGYNCYYKQLKRKEKSEEKLVKQIQTICDFINNRPETFKGVNGSVDKIITDYAERKEQECEELKKQIKFEFDETLLQYSNTIEDLQKQLKDSVMQKCPQCGETYLNPIGSKLYETLIEIKELIQSDYCTEIGSCEFCAEIGNCLNRKILHKISEVINE